MSFQLHKTAIYFKQFFSVKVLDEHTFIKLCNKIENFPFKEDYPVVKGLYLSGDHFFRKILFPDASKVTAEEIRKIDSITPIMDQGEMPFNFGKDFLEVKIPTTDKDFKNLLDSISVINDYFNDLFGENMDRKIEIHLVGGTEKQLVRLVVIEAIPKLAAGVIYLYEFVENKKLFSGEITITETVKKIPEEITHLIDFHFSQYNLKMVERQNRKNLFVLRHAKREKIEMSLYSNESSKFQKMLTVFEKAKLFESSVNNSLKIKIPQRPSLK